MRHMMRQNLRWLSSAVKWRDITRVLRKHPEQVTPKKLLHTVLALPLPWWQELDPKVAQDMLPLVRAACLRWGGARFVALHRALRATPNADAHTALLTEVVTQYNALPEGRDEKLQVAKVFAHWAATAWLGSHGATLYERLLCRQAWLELLALRNTLRRLPLQIRPLLLSVLEQWRPRQQHLLALEKTWRKLSAEGDITAQSYRFAMYLEGPVQRVELMFKNPSLSTRPPRQHSIGPMAARRLVDHMLCHLPQIASKHTTVCIVLPNADSRMTFQIADKRALQHSLMRMTQIRLP